MDKKGVVPGLSKECGDQDLFGHEMDVSLAQIKDRLDKELKLAEETSCEWGRLSKDEKMEKLTKLVKVVSGRIKDLRELYMKQNLALKKFMREGGDEWRNSKYVYAISSIQVQLYQIRAVVRRLLCANDDRLAI